MARHVKKGDNVVVLAGKYKGQQGKVLEVMKDKDRVRVEGIANVKRHLRPGADPIPLALDLHSPRAGYA